MEQFVIHDPIIRHIVEILLLSMPLVGLKLLVLIKGEE